MNNHELQKLNELEKYYWWHVGRSKILETFLEKMSLPKDAKILDVGCGTGETTKFLTSFGQVWGVDISCRALDFCRRQGLENLEQCGACNLPFEKHWADLVAMLDIVEHVEDDQLALKEAYRVLDKGGWLLVTVPALKYLWSDHDEALDHKRRYSKRELEEKIENAGFYIERLSYAVSFLALPIIVYRAVQKIFVQSAYPKTSYVILPMWLNTFFVFLLKIEAKLLKYVDLPFGVSLVCLARKH